MVATPEKALLDLIYLQPDGETPGYLQGLRLQNLDDLNLVSLRNLADEFDRPKLRKAVEVISRLALTETQGYEDL